MYSLKIGILLLILFAAAWHDIQTRRIPNVLVFPGAVAGLLCNALLPQSLGGGLAMLDCMAGLAVGLGLLLPLYLMRAMGAGDVKLMAMTGAFLGARGVTGALLYVLLAGGVLALGVAWHRGMLRKLLQNVKMMLIAGMAGDSITSPSVNKSCPQPVPESVVKLPYGVAIATGTMAYLVFVQRG